MLSRVFFACVALIFATAANSQATPGFHEGIEDCIATIADLDHPFLQADEVEGDVQNGFVAWYHDADKKPIYAVRLGVSGAGAEQVISCQGPPPMGPTRDYYAQNDLEKLEILAGANDLMLLDIPADGAYYANCKTDAPSLLIAITYDATNRVGVQVVKSAGVAQTCEKFPLKGQ